MYKINCQLFKDPKSSIDYSVCEAKWEEIHESQKAYFLTEMAENNLKMFENHKVNKGSKFAFSAGYAYQVVSYASKLRNPYIMINYAYCLLKAICCNLNIFHNYYL